MDKQNEAEKKYAEYKCLEPAFRHTKNLCPISQYGEFLLHWMHCRTNDKAPVIF
jgi:hypothetical protein